MMMRRVLIVGGLVTVLAAATIAPALADDLSDYLVEADDAIYSGRRVMGTTWDGVESIGVIRVQHHAGMTLVGSDSDYVVIGGGRMYSGGADEAAVSFVRNSHIDPGGRYTVVPGDATDYLGRSARIIDVMEGPLVRMRLIVDDSTAAPVSTEVYGADGSVFRYTSMIDFSVSADPASHVVEGRDYEMMLPLENEGTSDAIAGYQLVDIYDAPNGSDQSFFSDGLFSFSLFTANGWTDWAAMSDDEIPYRIDGDSYLRIVRPASVWVMWNGPGVSMALVGDLPPDHIEQVLAELPRPSTRAWFKRIWFRLFG